MLSNFLNQLQAKYPNLYIVGMMLCFIAFFDSVGRIFDYVLPHRDTIASLAVSAVVITCVIAIFTAQDGTLRELAIGGQEPTNTSAAAAAYMAVRGGIQN